MPKVAFTLACAGPEVPARIMAGAQRVNVVHRLRF
jgi:hypothetical protein